MLIQPDRFIQAGNPSWIPVASAWGLGFFLPLIGFFYLRTAIAFDESSGVAQLISTSPVGTMRYMLGKFCSGTLLLFCFAAVVILGSFFMMLWHFPGQVLSAYEFLSPFLFLLFVLPLCSALAVFCESSRLLRGAIGSVLYVVAFVAVLALVVLSDNPGLLLRSFDFSGTSVIVRGIERAVLEQSGEPMNTLLFLGGSLGFEPQPTAQLVFHGIPVAAADLPGYAGMLCVTGGLVALSAPLYRVTSALRGAKPLRKHRARRQPAAGVSGQKPLVTRSLATVPTDASAAVPADVSTDTSTYASADASARVSTHIPAYTPASPSGRQAILRGIVAELRLMLSGQPLIWRVVGLAGIALCLFLKLEMVQSYVLPLLMLWFVNVFSAMGSREHQHGMLDCIAALPNGRLKQVAFSWASGVLIASALTLPVLLRMLDAGQLSGMLACVAGAIFLPSLALFLGEFSRTRRVFEVAFVVITYLTLNKVTAAMYLGMASDDMSLVRAGIYLTAGIALAIAAVVKRTKD
jgi:hypothetical protein